MKESAKILTFGWLPGQRWLSRGVISGAVQANIKDLAIRTAAIFTYAGMDEGHRLAIPDLIQASHEIGIPLHRKAIQAAIDAGFFVKDGLERRSGRGNRAKLYRLLATIEMTQLFADGGEFNGYDRYALDDLRNNQAFAAARLRFEQHRKPNKSRTYYKEATGLCENSQRKYEKDLKVTKLFRQTRIDLSSDWEVYREAESVVQSMKSRRYSLIARPRTGGHVMNELHIPFTMKHLQQFSDGNWSLYLARQDTNYYWYDPYDHPDAPKLDTPDGRPGTFYYLERRINGEVVLWPWLIVTAGDVVSFFDRLHLDNQKAAKEIFGKQQHKGDPF